MFLLKTPLLLQGPWVVIRSGRVVESGSGEGGEAGGNRGW